MRLGELRNIIDNAATDRDELLYSIENLYEGKRFRVNSYSDLLRALIELSKQSWVKTDTSILDELISKYGSESDSIEISPEQEGRLSSLVNEINRNLPIFYGIIDTIVEEQEEQIVNIKLPIDSISDLSALNSFNKDLQEVFTLIVKYKGLNGNIKFDGIDIGSSWYKILILGSPLVYSAFMGSIDIARDLIHLRKEWYESEDIRIEVELKEKKGADQIDKKDIDKYIDEKIEKKLHRRVQSLIAKLPNDDSKNLSEMETSISKGIQKTIKLIEQGTEFHPSLNPPEYIKENNQTYSIDYDKVRNLIIAEREKNTASKRLEHKPLVENTNTKKLDDGNAP